MRSAGVSLAGKFRAGGTSALLVLLGWWFLSTALTAQTAAPVRSPLHFTVFSPQPIVGLNYDPKPGAAPAKLTFYPTARSPSYEYRGGMPLRFRDDTGTVDAEASVPSEMRDVLLLFSADIPGATSNPAKANGGLKYRISVLDDSAARLSAGGLTIINFSGLALAGVVDGNDVTLKEGLNLALSLNRSAKIVLRTIAKGRTYQSYAATVQMKKGERALLILFPPYYPNSLEVQSRLLVDQPPGASPPPAR